MLLEWCEMTHNDNVNMQTVEDTKLQQLLAAFHQFVVASYNPSTVPNLRSGLRRYFRIIHDRGIECFNSSMPL